MKHSKIIFLYALPSGKRKFKIIPHGILSWEFEGQLNANKCEIIFKSEEIEDEELIDEYLERFSNGGDDEKINID